MFRPTFGALSALATLVAVVMLTPAASAAALSAAEGAPNVTDSSPAGYFIFHDENGFHIRTHGPGTEHDFVAVLHSTGTFENLDLIKLESADSVAVSDGGHRLVMHFHTFDGIDGLNFRVNGGDDLRLDLKLDDQQASTSQIFLGPRGHHPKHDPFTIHF
jgi:hypothetical protein